MSLYVQAEGGRSPRIYNGYTVEMDRVIGPLSDFIFLTGVPLNGAIKFEPWSLTGSSRGVQQFSKLSHHVKPLLPKAQKCMTAGASTRWRSEPEGGEPVSEKNIQKLVEHSFSIFPCCDC